MKKKILQEKIKNRTKKKREEEERLKFEEEKREKEQQKAIKKERKNLRTLIKNHNYFAINDDERVKLMDDIERLVDLLTLNEIQALNESLQKNENEQTIAKNLVMEMLTNMNIRLEEERKEQLSQAESKNIKKRGVAKESKSAKRSRCHGYIIFTSY